eukprot:14986646-Alexandrium_andersonii.AAC.1
MVALQGARLLERHEAKGLELIQRAEHLLLAGLLELRALAAGQGTGAQFLILRSRPRLGLSNQPVAAGLRHEHHCR